MYFILFGCSRISYLEETVKQIYRKGKGGDKANLNRVRTDNGFFVAVIFASERAHF